MQILLADLLPIPLSFFQAFFRGFSASDGILSWHITWLRYWFLLVEVPGRQELYFRFRFNLT